MAEKNIGKVTQVIGAVLDVKYAEGQLPQINEAVEIIKKAGFEEITLFQKREPRFVRC